MAGLWQRRDLWNLRGNVFGDISASVVALPLALAFRAASEMTRRMSMAEQFEELVVDVHNVPTLDASAPLPLETIIQRTRQQGRQVVLAGRWSRSPR